MGMGTKGLLVTSKECESQIPSGVGDGDGTNEKVKARLQISKTLR